VTLEYTGTYFTKYDTQNLDGSFSPGIGVINVNTGGVVPRQKTYLVVNWATGPWSFTLAQNWQSGYEDIPGSAEDTSDPNLKPRRVGTYETYDGQVQYTGVKNLRMTFGIKNLFNR